MRGPRSHRHRGNPAVRRTMQARRWMRENPTRDDTIAMLEEYQRDLEQEVATVADRIRRLREQSAPTEA